jgi:3-phosphoshikimate 1-carboxyvinyltransferase
VIVHGRARPPGDKSISHRVLFLAGLARGRNELRGLLASDDVAGTARILRALGIAVAPVRAGAVVRVEGRGLRLRAPAATLHCGNSGTTARLGLGVLAGQRFSARLTGDASLRRRPMRRVTEPLRAMGATISGGDGDGLPLTIRGGDLRPLQYASPVASAQVKGCLLLAALTGGARLVYREPFRSRDHSERLFAHLGLDLHERDGAIEFRPGRTLEPFALTVPGDISSAAYLVAAAVLAEGGDLVVEDVGVNPTRTGFLEVLGRMGAGVERLNLRDVAGEPVADLLVRPARLRATEVAGSEIPRLIDEVPVLAVLAGRAEGDTVFHDVGELRVKESDRLTLLAENLRRVGVTAEARGNDLHVRGTDRPPRGRVETARDHRLAMAFAVLGTVPGADVRLSERRSVAVSYRGFFRDLRRIGARGRGKGDG